MRLYKEKSGFTLIEILVSSFILILVVVAASQMYVTASSAQRRAYGKQNALDSSRYALEYMGRAIRQSTIPPDAFNVNNQIELHHPDATKCPGGNAPCSVYYRINSGRIQESLVALNNSPTNWQNITEITSVQVVTLRFTGSAQDSGVQPKVTVAMTIRPALQNPNEESLVRIQTTITSRDPRWLSTQ